MCVDMFPLSVIINGGANEVPYELRKNRLNNKKSRFDLFTNNNSSAYAGL
jgi:hypothetical protein